MLSLGTGVESCSNKMPKADMSSLLSNLWFQTTQPSLTEDLTLADMLEPEASYRFQHRFEECAPSLDDTRDETVSRLIECGNTLLEENKDLIREVCKVVSPESF